MGKKFTEEQKKWVIENYCEYRNRKDFVDDFNNLFNEARGENGFTGIVKLNCLHLKEKFTDEEQRFIDSMKGQKYESIRRAFKEKYGREIHTYDLKKKSPYRKLKSKEIREKDCVYCLESCTSTGKECDSSANCYCRLEECPYEL